MTALIEPTNPFPGAAGEPTGGPDDVETPQGGANPPPVAQPKKLQAFGKSFDNAEELLEYTKETERQLVESRLAHERERAIRANNPQTTLQNPAGSAVKAPEGPGVDELLFTDPKKAIERLRGEIKEEVRREQGQKDAERKFWADFYEENPDLRNAERIVQSVVREKWEDVSILPVADARKVLAQETRGIIDKVSGGGGTRTELPRTSASSLPASGGTPPAVPVVQGEPENFMAQLKKHQAKHRKIA